jgi:DNA-binding response OmpR family regulator
VGGQSAIGAHPSGVDPIEIRADEMQVLIDGRRAGLTAREFELFVLLADRNARVVLRTKIYEEMWGAMMPRRDRSVDVLVHRLRSKLRLASPEWRYIHTHFGIGYRYEPERLPG